MARLDSFLRLVAEQQASDLHFHAGNPPVIRYEGDLMPLPFRELSNSETRRFVMEILTDKQKAILKEKNEVDFVYDLDEAGRFRVNVFQQSHGMGAVFRVVPNRLPTIDELMLPPSVHRLTQASNGLVLITGPTGAGKTTTLAAIINEMNEQTTRHIITVEDPIEFVFRPKKCMITQRQVGEHCESFPAALRSALRESPDVLVVGEMRDLETIKLALSAAETGVLVFATLHTNSAAKGVHRIIDTFPEDAREQARAALSMLLKGVVAQHLVKRSTGDGRVAVLEIMLQNFATSTMIRDNKIHQLDAYLANIDPETGMLGLDQCLFQYVREGIVEEAEAMRLANDPAHLKELIATIPADEL